MRYCMIKVFHGSDFLGKGSKPRSKGREGGAYFTDDTSFAREFGRTIHVFLLDEESVLDLRLEDHKVKVLDAYGEDTLKTLTNSKSGLVPATDEKALYLD